MSEYENVVVGKLRPKGKALGVRGDGISKKKKSKKQFNNFSQAMREDDLSSGMNATLLVDCSKENMNMNDMLTPAERRYLQQWEKIDVFKE